MHFTLALWIFLLVANLQVKAPMPTAKEIESLKRGQVIWATHQNSRNLHSHSVIFLDFVPSWYQTTLRTAAFGRHLPQSVSSTRKVKFNEIFTEVPNRYGSLDDEIDLKFMYVSPKTITIPHTKTLLNEKEVDDLERKMNAVFLKQINSLERGRLVRVSTRVLYDEKPIRSFSLAILLDCTQSQEGSTVTIAHFSTNLPRSVPPKCRADFKNYFTDTMIRSMYSGKNSLLQGQIDLRFHTLEVKPGRIDLPADTVRLKPEEVNKLTAEMGICDKDSGQLLREDQRPSNGLNPARVTGQHLAPSYPSHPTQELINSLKIGQVISVCSNVFYQAPPFPPYHWNHAIFLGYTHSQDGTPHLLRIISFSQELPYHPPYGFSGVFEEYLPGNGFKGQIDLRIHCVYPGHIYIPSYRIQLNALQVEHLDVRIRLAEHMAMYQAGYHIHQA